MLDEVFLSSLSKNFNVIMKFQILKGLNKETLCYILKQLYLTQKH
jgi:hypothetical protein